MMNSSLLTPDQLPDDTALVVPTLTSTCVVCGIELFNLWDAQCCRRCLKCKIKEETKMGLIVVAKRSIEEYSLQPGSLVALWWRGNLETMFLRMILTVGTKEGNVWFTVLDPITATVSCWGVHIVQMNINTSLRGRQLGIQKLF